MFMYGPVDLLILAVALAIVIKPIARAAGEFARARATDRDRDRNLDRGLDPEGRERIEALEDRVRLLEERQDFTEKLVSGRRDAPRIQRPLDAPSSASGEDGGDPSEPGPGEQAAPAGDAASSGSPSRGGAPAGA